MPPHARHDLHPNQAPRMHPPHTHTLHTSSSSSPVSATLRSVCLNAHTMESINSFVCTALMASRQAKQWVAMACSSPKKRSRCSGWSSKLVVIMVRVGSNTAASTCKEGVMGSVC